ncbi:hypothetical protein C5167_032465 [Papaver somniferum]|uniref:NAD-dependent epimerase/dehydratase domain-containing protein n=1 Tax=Papaver somniferum TaxID=3469 RepID=A0A4Y7K910_PAPSO|nr:hypothetical protein C5167_032465 [Papaver somniferum]
MASSLMAFTAISSPPGSHKRQTTIPTRTSLSRRYSSQNRLCSISVSCSYAGANAKEDFTSTTIDVVADVRAERVVVLGGSGFVGSAICKAAVSKGIEAVSLSRSGRPNNTEPWVDQVTWLIGMFLQLKFWIQVQLLLENQPPPLASITREVPIGSQIRETRLLATICLSSKRDVFYANWDEVLVGATAVVSTIGGFGSDEQMKKINGEANVLAVDAAKEYGIPKFVLISVHDYNLPPFLLSSGYFTGKRKAESEVLSKFPNNGVVLRPGFIYGKRKVDGFEIPLDLVGEPLERFLKAAENFTKPLNSLPASDLLLAPPVSVDDVALAVINAVRDDDFFGVFTIEQIKIAASNVRV